MKLKPWKNRTPWRLFVSLLLALALAASWIPGAALAETAEQADEVRQLLEDYHLSKPDDAKLNGEAIDAMVKSLHDPYTEYFTPEEWQSFNSLLEQSFTGIGIVITQENGRLYIEDVLPESPAEAAGMLPGDEIVSAEGGSVKGFSLSDLQTKLRGKEGTSVSVGVLRNGKSLVFTLVRKSIQLPVATGQMMGDGVGYLALSGFTSEAGQLFKQQLQSLEKAGMKSLIIDLRNNGGGYVTAAQQIAGLFIKEGVLAHMKDRDGNDDPLKVSGESKSYPVTILVNEKSASASELFAGAMQDYGIAKLVGTRTFGKGVVQQIVPLRSGGVLKLTVQEYFTPNGRKVNDTGLKPDDPIEGVAEQLIGAFRDAGGKTVSVTTGKGAILLNGVRTARPYSAAQRGSRWFVNVRLAAALVGSTVAYDKKTGAITLAFQGKSYKLEAKDSRLIQQAGWNLIDLSALQAWFPGLKAETAGGQLKLTFQ